MFCRNNEDHDLQAKNRPEIERDVPVDAESELGLRYDFMDRFDMDRPASIGKGTRSLTPLALPPLSCFAASSIEYPSAPPSLLDRGSDRGNRRSNRVKGESEERRRERKGMKVNLPPIKCVCVSSVAEGNEKQRPSEEEEDEIAAALLLLLLLLACICSIAPTCVIVTPHLTRRRRVADSRALSEKTETEERRGEANL